jgi:putative transposase
METQPTATPSTRLPALFAKFWADFESELVRMDSEDHHIHLLVNYPPKVAVSHLVNRQGRVQQNA